MRAGILSKPTEPHRISLVLGFLILLAWSLLAAWQRSAYAELLGHESIEDNHIPFAVHLAAFLLSWCLMTVAMMLPGSLSMIIHYVKPVRQQMKNFRMVEWITLGYLAPWVLFGLLVYLGDSFLHRMAEPTAPLGPYSDTIAPAIVLIAGLYQFTPVKHYSLNRCRTPSGKNLPSDDEEIGGAGAIKQGLGLGVFCAGSCWPLMLLMFALGQQRLDCMLALSGIIAAERLAPWGQRLAWLVGFVLVTWAATWVLAPL